MPLYSIYINVWVSRQNSQLLSCALETSHRSVKSTLAQALEEPLRDQAFYITLSHIELAILRQVDSSVEKYY